MHSFLDHVAPFARVLHKPRLLFELNHYRRGILQDCKEFKAQLAVVNALALLPLSPEECFFHFGAGKQNLMQNLKDEAARGLGRMQIMTSHRIRTLQSLILYIVSSKSPEDTITISSL
jgi:hypothetical protein